MNFLEERIMKDGIVKPGNVLKVDSFLNHQLDTKLMEEIGKEVKAGDVLGVLTLTDDFGNVKEVNLLAAADAVTEGGMTVVLIAAAALVAVAIVIVFAKKGKAAKVSFGKELYNDPTRVDTMTLIPEDAAAGIDYFEFPCNEFNLSDTETKHTQLKLACTMSSGDKEHDRTFRIDQVFLEPVIE